MHGEYIATKPGNKISNELSCVSSAFSYFTAVVENRLKKQVKFMTFLVAVGYGDSDLTDRTRTGPFLGSHLSDKKTQKRQLHQTAQTKPLKRSP